MRKIDSTFTNKLSDNIARDLRNDFNEMKVRVSANWIGMKLNFIHSFNSYKKRNVN